ncbi:MAG: penicillin-insensitive murein endopeptidase [Syntrophobacteraceae bacterium]
MTRCRPFRKTHAERLVLVVLLVLSFTSFDRPLHALTASVGEPSRGRLVNGVQFPSGLAACRLGNEQRSYAAPEVVGALLAALESFEETYPHSCDVFIGDFSRKDGGRLGGHESHQNGRDVDMGLFATGNVPLGRFVSMNSRMLDAPKTWRMIECLLATQRVQVIFLDRSIQEPLHKYALSQGRKADYLSKVFRDAGGGGGREGIIQHAPNHRNHMHIRFLAPWSTLAGQLKAMGPEQHAIIETAQQSCLPHQAVPDAWQNGKDSPRPAQVSGFRPRGLCKFNGLSVWRPSPNAGGAHGHPQARG